MTIEVGIALVGVGGTLAGGLLAWAQAHIGDKRRQVRDDLVWRREYVLEAGAELLVQLGVLEHAAMNVNSYAHALSAAQAAGHVESVKVHGAQLDAERGRMNTATTAANAAVRRVAVLGGDELQAAGIDYMTEVLQAPGRPLAAQRGAYVADLLQEQVGMVAPPRLVPGPD